LSDLTLIIACFGADYNTNWCIFVRSLFWFT